MVGQMDCSPLVLDARIAKDVVAERFGPDKKVKDDMLGSFIRHGLTKKAAESEVAVQMCVSSPVPFFGC